MTAPLQSRVFALDDISIRNDGTGRTVTAYAAVFNSPTQIRDQDGHYDEQIARTAFDKTLQERAGRFGVFYNHARTLHGTPSESGSVPIGTPLEVRADSRGLLTVTRYNKTQLADDVLESIRNGDITGQSFTGRFIKSDPRGPYLPQSTGERTLVTRQEIALLEYGPTPIPAYSDAAIIGVRAADQGNITAANAADLESDARQYAASQGWAMDDGSYPIRPLDNHGRNDLEAAIQAVGRGSGSHDAIRAHIAERAEALGLTDLLPAGWPSGRDAVELTLAGASDRQEPALDSDATTSDDDATASTSSTSEDPEEAVTSAADDGTEADNPQETTPEAAPERTEPRQHSATTDRSLTETRNDMSDDRLTVEERAARQSEIRARLQEIETEFSGSEMPQEVRSEWDQLFEENGAHARAIRETEQRRAQLRTVLDSPTAGERVDTAPSSYLGGTGPAVIRTRDIYDLTEARQQARSVDDLPGIYRDRAMRAIELAQFPGVRSREDAQERARHLVETKDDEQGTLARRMLRTGSPTYNRAFGKMVTKQNTNGLTAEESRALALGVDASGGYAVPFQLDPTVILTSDGTINPLRQVARVEQIVGKEWQGVTSAGVTVTRGGEADEAPDSTPTLAQPSVGTTRVQGFVPFSVEIERSWSEMSGEITMMLQDAKDTEEAASFTNGDGTGDNPFGLFKTLATGSNVAGTAAGLAVPHDVDAVEEALAPRWRSRASWLAAKSTYNRIREAAVQNPSYSGDIWVKLSGNVPPQLIGYDARELSTAPTIPTSGTTPNRVLAFGDFKTAFIIVDRIGMSIELVPHLFGANGRPTGQRGIYAYWSNGSKVLVDAAVKVLTLAAPST